MTKSFNPLEARKLPENTPKTAQSREVAPPPPPPLKFDTTTPAGSSKTVRRFDLNDVPRYGVNLLPHLKQIFPHIHDRMYAGWLRQCMDDNACHFIVIEGSVALAFLAYDPMNPVPVVNIAFVFGNADDLHILYKDIVRWAESLGASEVRQRQYSPEQMARVAAGCGFEPIYMSAVNLRKADAS